tara:strand:- start:39 stop:197 length:159 start_codon:yes stop_codon:yes gene_type:complete
MTQIISLIIKALKFTFQVYAIALLMMAVSGILWAIYALISGEFNEATFGIME